MHFEFSQDGFTKAAESGNLQALELFLKGGMDPNSRDSKNWSPLSMAALKGQVAAAKILLDRGADPNENGTSDRASRLTLSQMSPSQPPAEVEHGIVPVWTAPRPVQMPVLILATMGGNAPLVQALLDKGAQPNTVDNRGWSALFWAIHEARLDVITLLISKGADVHLKNLKGETPIQYAVLQGNAAVVQALLDGGVPVDAADNPQKWTPLMLASRFGNEPLVQLLLNRGANPHLVDYEDATPLLRAALNNHPKIVRQLLEKGADPNFQSKAVQRWTPLMAAAHSEALAVAQILLNAGADPNRKGAQNSTALLIACLKGNKDLVTLLVDKKADIHVHESVRGNTPLFIAMSKNAVDVALFLLKKGADPNAMDQTGFTATMLAAQSGLDTILVRLLEKGANPNAQTLSTKGRTGMTALMYAAAKGNFRAIQILAQHGANGDLKDSDGATAYNYAVYNQHHEIADFLLQLHRRQTQSPSSAPRERLL